ncbi:predicted protein [Postia placenta Mad-698-R]|nr:predicted protein [Postia placenta Mad-698-R]
MSTDTNLPGSTLIRARSPHPLESETPIVKHPTDNPNSMELAELGKRNDLSTSASLAERAKTPDSRLQKVHKHRARIQFAVMCFSLFMAGWNDGTTGPLLPRMQKVYHVGFAVVSLIFVFACLGFVTGATANVALTDRFGFGTVMVIGSVAQMIGYAIESSAPPFPAFVLGYAVNGFGMTLARMGFGALCSPLVATQFSQLPRWSFHYLISLGIAFINTVLLAVVLRFRTQNECLAAIGEDLPQTGAPGDGAHMTGGAANDSSKSKYKQMFRLKELHLLALFIFIYVGIEVTVGGNWLCILPHIIAQALLQGWIVTYVIEVRSGGLTLGRVALLWVNKTTPIVPQVGERRVLFIYSLLAIGYETLNRKHPSSDTYIALTRSLELVVWLVPSLIGGAVAVSLVGVLLGPIYPIAMNHSGRVFPQWLLTGCIGWIAGIGQAGSAFLPFLTGLLASKEGILTLQPLLVSMMGAMVVLWAIVPGHAPRVD